MGSVVAGFVGAMIGALWAFKSERPMFAVFVFALTGFALFYGAELFVEIETLGGL